MLFKDLRYAFRMVRRAPMFTAAVVLTVALAIAANTAIFSVVNAVMLRPLPFRDPGRLVQVAEKNDKLNLPNFGASVLNFLSWRDETRTFEELAAIGFGAFTLTGVGEPEQLSGSRISPALTRVLGIRPIAGRAFTDDEEKPNAAAVAMVGEGLWKRRFGADLSVVGRTITLNDVPTTVVGIAPASLNLITGGDVYAPLTIDPAKEIRLNHVIFVAGRLKAGVIGALWALDGINSALPPNVLPVPGVHMDATVLVFAVGLTIATGLLFGLAPAWRMAKVDLNDVLKQTGRGSAGGRGARLRNGLSVAEI